MVLVSAFVFVIAFGLCFSRAAAKGDNELQIHLRAGLPFSVATLRRALALRIAKHVAPATISLRPIGKRSLLIEVQATEDPEQKKRRLIPLLGLGDARRVALIVADLLSSLGAPGSQPTNWPPKRPPKRWRKKLPGLSALVAGLLLSGSGTADANTKKDAAELRARLDDLRRYKRYSSEYAATLHRVAKQTYLRQKRGVQLGQQRRLRMQEARERLQRQAAIALFEGFLRRYPANNRYTPDVIFRLAELYFEQQGDRYLTAMETYERALQSGATPPAMPKRNLTKSIALYRRLVRDFPRYRLIDGAYYLLGYCLGEAGKIQQARQSYLALVCANKHRPPTGETAAARKRAPAQGLASRFPTATSNRTLDTSAYAGCRPLVSSRRFFAEAWLRVGEAHFDDNQLALAIAAYRHVLRSPDAAKRRSLYEAALYKLAWTYYRADRYVEAITHFDRLVREGDARQQKGKASATAMRPESIQYLAISFAEPDWDGDGKPDGASGKRRIERFYKGRHRQRHVAQVFRRMGQIYFDTTRYDEAVAIFRTVLKRWPELAHAPEVHEKLISALSQLQRHAAAASARDEMIKAVGPRSRWALHHRAHAKRLERAKELRLTALIARATSLHQEAKGLRDRALADVRRAELIVKASRTYGQAATRYEALLEAAPGHRRALDLRQAYASCLFYSSRFLRAAEQFERVAKGAPSGSLLKKTAHYSATKAYESHIGVEIREGKLSRPALPGESGARPPSSAAKEPSLPEPYQRWRAALLSFAQLFPNDGRTPKMLYKAGEIDLRFLLIAAAQKTLSRVYSRYFPLPIASTAGRAILATAAAQGDKKTIALWTARLRKSKCPRDRSDCLKIRREADDLHYAQRFKTAQGLLSSKAHLKAAEEFLVIAEQAPKAAMVAKSLFNAALAYQRANRSTKAALVYDRLFREHPRSEFAERALVNGATASARLLDFAQALRRYLVLAEAPRFAKSSHRRNAIFNAAVIYERQQNYKKAARFFQRFFELALKVDDKLVGAFRAAECLEKARQTRAASLAYSRFLRAKRKLDNNAADHRVIAALATLGVLAERRGQTRKARRYRKQAEERFHRGGHAPGSEAASWAARAGFAAAKELHAKVSASKIRGSITGIAPQIKRMQAQAAAAQKAYQSVWRYKRLKFTLAAVCQVGLIYEHLAREIDSGFRKAPVPRRIKRLGSATVAQYLKILDGRLVSTVDPLIAQAERNYRACLDTSKKFRTWTDDAQRAAERLHALNPAKYPRPKPSKVIKSID